MEKRERRINYWLSEKDLDLIDRRAKEAKLSRSEFIRRLLREAEVIPTPDVDYLWYASEFKRLGDILNSYSKSCNQTGVLNPNAEKVWSDISALWEKLKQELIEKTVDLEVEVWHAEK